MLLLFIAAGPGTASDLEEPGTFTQGAPDFPGSSRLGIQGAMRFGTAKPASASSWKRVAE